jgi:hypothetical protein
VERCEHCDEDVACKQHPRHSEINLRQNFFNVRGLIFLPHSHVSPLWDFLSSPRFVARSYMFCDNRPCRCGAMDQAFYTLISYREALVSTSVQSMWNHGYRLFLEQVFLRIRWFSPISIVPAVFHTESPNTGATNILAIDRIIQ